MFKHHKLDSILVLISLLQVSLLVIPFFFPLSYGQLSLLVIINAFLVGTNYQCVAHNFIHNPFFKSSTLNKLFSLLNSFGIGMPSSAYRIHHLEHHRHNNRPDKDDTSTFKYGKYGQEENIILYSSIGIIRTDIPELCKIACKHSTLVLAEVLLMVIFVVGLSLLNWKLFLGYVMTSYLIGQFFALWENYCEHHHADYNDRKRDSVSCYNSVYNFLWFNNGYHQEHHYAPTLHWSQITSVKEKLPADRIIVDACHLSNSFNLFKPK